MIKIFQRHYNYDYNDILFVLKWKNWKKERFQTFKKLGDEKKRRFRACATRAKKLISSLK